MTKPVILWLSDSPFFNTGYATISRNICNALSKDFEVHYLANGYTGQTTPPRGVTFQDGLQLDFWIHGNGREQYFKDLIMPLIQKHKPVYFVVLLDTFMLFPWIIDYDFRPAKSLFYFPSDGENKLPADCEHLLRRFDLRVAMAKFGQKQAKDKYNIDSFYIPHAVDTNIFRPLSDMEKQQLRADHVVVTVNGSKVKGFLANKFVVGVVARNQSRKMLDRGIKAFAEFCKDKPDAVFYMHTDPDDPAAPFNMRRLITELHLENRVVFSEMRFSENYEYKDMQKVYNCMDVFFLSTSGEGFGIPIIEAMACEVPCAVTDYTTTKELLVENGQCGIPVPCESLLMGGWEVDRGIMSIPYGAKTLNHFYSNKDVCKQLGKTGREKVVLLYNWDKILPQWVELFKKNIP
jgi:glycosyltransferase involved in cell wall biosynthesis